MGSSELIEISDFQELVDRLQKTIAKTDFDSHIFAKYCIKKYSLTQTIGENDLPLEVFVYNEDSLPYPILEDQALKRGASIVAAARLLFAREDLYKEADDQAVKDRMQKLVVIEKAFKDSVLNICKSFDISLEVDSKKEKDVSAKPKLTPEQTVALLTQHIDKLINDVLIVWANASTNLTKNHYEIFYHNIWLAIEEQTADINKTQLCVINEDPAVRSIQYVARGADIGSHNPNHHSAHQRHDEGVGNFMRFVSGHLNAAGKAIMTDTFFGHASLPPIDRYKQADKVKSHVDCIEITKKNIAEVCEEMTSADSSLSKNQAVWLNISLLTVDQPFDKEQQDRQYRETILAGEYFAIENPSVLPLLFCFGVNIAEVAPVINVTNITYPIDQQFENQRHFLTLNYLVWETLRKIIFKNPEEMQPLEEVINAYLESQKYYNLVKLLNSCLQLTIHSPSNVLELRSLFTESDVNVMPNLTELNQHLTLDKESRINYIKSLFCKPMKELYHEFLQTIPSLNAAVTAAEKIFKPNSHATYLLADYKMIISKLEKNAWRTANNAFLLQAYLADLGKQMQFLGEYSVYVSGNCKSCNDRGPTWATFVDGIRARRVVGNDFSPQKHYIGSAFVHVPILDSGGASKFVGEHMGIKINHPCREFAKLLVLTSKWANHKLPKKYLKRHPGIVFAALLEEKAQETPNAYAELYKKYFLNSEFNRLLEILSNEQCEEWCNAILKPKSSSEMLNCNVDLIDRFFKQFHHLSDDEVKFKVYFQLKLFFEEVEELRVNPSFLSVWKQDPKKDIYVEFMKIGKVNVGERNAAMENFYKQIIASDSASGLHVAQQNAGPG